MATALAIVAVSAVTAGCGGGGSALALDPVAAAATKTQQAGAARVHFSVAFSGPRTHGKTQHIRGGGVVDGTSSELTFGLGGLGSAGLSFVPATDKNAPVKVISLEQNGDYVVYVQSGLLSGRLPGGQHWVELNLSKVAQAKGIDLGTLLSAGQVQPGDVLSMLEAEGAKVRSLGPDTVDGVATTHYRVTLDIAKALQAKGLTNPLLKHMAAKTPNVPLNVWIGKDGLVHRVQASFAHARNGVPAHLGLTVDVYDYGAKATIAAPPSSDVFDATQLVQSFGGYSN
jgi:hypothetical protein